ncbi:MAG: 16S rRNA (guanine(527)-N(7))-methyltransferase RsmG [Gammaproteobacteria bacterium]|nr:16S rRNA (guanine(527)-N(7))-methyltransferase RsmG [Gammaproteobacteria bacterium]MCW8840307.1 16S rRNA (guanine(527)-N(7))-methyltransferase RsmG [Gammaproteobacteria bacterium]MCW8958067.1 16S rRNA (guanine(527)-N(7))-methyltransferase RsmG [Gammaproteobacteria bacterium]MCW8972330.1 16S rRNA (guanine(527)-N(7))-methyltransferase RsmG [Gammaproteobacteria bacterium]MCW8992278.1 16S rRNA (guanine(527)-N(7))-methyltransferase RsmG [Gammaproteobacteria bacterium]
MGFSVTDLRAKLDAGLERLGLDLPEAVRDGLIAYVELLAKWNRAYNLTAVRDPAEMVTRHLLDSLAVVPHLEGERIIDVGTGGGLPGIPLALVFPERRFVLLDANSKKTRFLIQARAVLGLENVEVVHARVEQYHDERPFDCIITRAFASVTDILTNSRHLLTRNGEFLAMKGVVPDEELAALPQGFCLDEVIPLRVPGLEQEQRHLLRIRHEQ